MKRHSADLLSLGFGLLFLAIPIVALLAALLDVPSLTFAWAAAGALVVGGVLGIVHTVLRSRANRRADRDVADPAGPR